MHNLYVLVHMASLDNWVSWVPFRNTVHWRLAADPQMLKWACVLFSQHEWPSGRARHWCALLQRHQVRRYGSDWGPATGTAWGQDPNKGNRKIKPFHGPPYWLKCMIKMGSVYNMDQNQISIVPVGSFWMIPAAFHCFLVHFSWPCGDWISLKNVPPEPREERFCFWQYKGSVSFISDAWQVLEPACHAT